MADTEEPPPPRERKVPQLGHSCPERCSVHQALGPLGPPSVCRFVDLLACRSPRKVSAKEGAKCLGTCRFITRELQEPGIG